MVRNSVSRLSAISATLPSLQARKKKRMVPSLQSPSQQEPSANELANP